MQLWFYKAAEGDLLDKLVGWWTGGKYSHVELVFSDGTCFSSSPRDGGVRFKQIKASPHWDVVDLKEPLTRMIQENFAHKFKSGFNDWNHVADLYEGYVREWCETQVGKKYDWKAILGHLLSERDLEERRAWYCSEIILAALKRHNLYGGTVRLHPGEMYARIEGVEPQQVATA